MTAQADRDALSTTELLRENEKLRKIVNVLMARVERSTDAQGNAFSLFQAAITLESTVRQRTVELQSLNRELSARNRRTSRDRTRDFRRPKPKPSAPTREKPNFWPPPATI